MKLAIIIPFSVGILLLFAVCVCCLIYIFSGKAAAKTGALKLLCGAIIPFLFCGLIYLCCFYEELTPIFVTEERITYEVGSEEEKVQISVVDVAKEKGHEDIYTIELDIFGLSFLDNKRTIPASVYNEYIGAENNTITVKWDYIKIDVAAVFQVYTYEVERMYLPWEERIDDGFTNEDVTIFIDTLVARGGGIRTSDIDLDFDYFTKGHCAFGGANITSGKQEAVDRE